MPLGPVGRPIEHSARAPGHRDRPEPLQGYCQGLLLPGERKSVEPMAARLHPDRVQAARQCFHHLVAKAPWSDEAVLAAVRAQVLPAMTCRQPIVEGNRQGVGIALCCGAGPAGAS
jgi:SRSO17 transposase